MDDAHAITEGPDRETLYLVDSHSLIYQVFHAVPEMTSPAGLPTNAVFGFTRDLFYLRNEVKPSHIVCAFDVGEPTLRTDLYAEYKAHRSPMPDPLRLQIPMIREMLEAMRIPVLGLPGYEADDVIATLAVAGAARGVDVSICSSDKDCRQLLGDRVRVFNLRKREAYDAKSLAADWGVRPEQVVDFQTLVGDSVDNVPGALGIGPKTAAQLLQTYGTLDNLMAHLDEIKGKRQENLRAFLPQLPVTRKLVTLDISTPVAIDWDAWRVQPWNAPKLLELFRAWGFHRLADQVRASVERVAPVVVSVAVQGSLFGEGASATPQAAQGAAWEHTYHLVQTAEGFADFLTQLRRQPRFAMDLETTSLNPRDAQIVGVAIAWKEAEAWYLALRGPAGEKLLDPAETLAQLKPVLEDPAVEKINQNIKYDWHVLKAQGIELAGVVGDPMIADYLLHAGERSHGLDVMAEKHLGHRVIPITDLIGKGKKQLCMDQVPAASIAEYAGEDADVAWRLASKLHTMLADAGHMAPTANPQAGAFALYDHLEIPLIGVLVDMEHTGIRLDMPLLTRLGGEMEQSLAGLEQEIYQLAGKKFNIGSVKQLRDILFKDMGLKSGKRTAIGGVASTDQETLEQLARQGVEFARKLLEHRKIAKLKSTYVDALPALVHAKTGRVHASFNQTVAATGRLSSSEPNLQNIPIRSEQGGQIRQAFLPEEGWLLLTADYSQIELRLLAHFSGDEALRQAFAEDQDIHTLVAAQIFSTDPDDVSAAMRRVAKTVNFGVIYGMSAYGLSARLEIDAKQAEAFIDAYFAKYPRVLEYQEKLLAACRQRGYVATILGRRRAITMAPGREKSTYRSRNQPEREAINMEIQGSAADLIKMAMLNVHRRLRAERRRARLLLQIHDELVFEVPPEERAAICKLVREEMTGALADRIAVPIKVDMSIGPNWLETVEVTE
jgi:DNA polymerase I